MSRTVKSMPETAKLTIRLPRDRIEFAKRYAKRHGVTVTEVISRYIAALQDESDGELSPETLCMVGVLAPDLDLDSVRHDHLKKKHG